MVDGYGTGVGFHREPWSHKTMRDTVAIAIKLQTEIFVDQWLTVSRGVEAIDGFL
jgi:hypothetical protein